MRQPQQRVKEERKVKVSVLACLSGLHSLMLTWMRVLLLLILEGSA